MPKLLDQLLGRRNVDKLLRQGDTDRLWRLVRDKDPAMRLAALQALIELKEPRLVPELRDLLRSDVGLLFGDDNIAAERAVAIPALVALAPDVATQEWRAALSKKRYDVEAPLLRALKEQGAAPSIECIASAMSVWDDPHTHQYLANLLAETGSGEAAARLAEKLAVSSREKMGILGDALARLGMLAAPPLVPLLYSEFAPVRAEAARVLAAVGWQPTGAHETTTFLIAAGRWAEAVSQGPKAVLPALKAIGTLPQEEQQAALAGFRGAPPGAIPVLLGELRNCFKGNPRLAAVALEQAGWQPGDDAEAVWYWLARRDDERLAKMGSAAVALLVSLLRERTDKGPIIDGGAKGTVACALARMYRGGQLGAAERQLIEALQGHVLWENRSSGYGYSSDTTGEAVVISGGKWRYVFDLQRGADKDPWTELWVGAGA